VYFARSPSRTSKVWKLMELSGIVDLVGDQRRFVKDTDMAVEMTQAEILQPKRRGDEDAASIRGDEGNRPEEVPAEEVRPDEARVEETRPVDGTDNS